MNLCNHIKNNNNNVCETEETGFCISCNGYKCYECLNFNYNSCIQGEYGKTKLFYMKNDLVYKFPDYYSFIIKSYKELNILSICYDCIERINHPSFFE